MEKLDKLIELLNKYEKKTVVHWYEWYWEDVLMCRYIKDNFEFYTDEATTIAISKYYWFIKWLVDNDKIVDFVDKKETLVSLRKWSTSPLWYIEMVTPKYEQLLMLLAIQDEPIEFLISILK